MYIKFNNYKVPRRGGFRRGIKINPALYVRKAEGSVVSEEYSPTNSFEGLMIAERLKENILAKGYSVMTPIQDQAITQILEGKDIVGLANTGTGKTAAFLIPLIHQVYFNRSDKVLIVAPTRELAVQIQDELKVFTKGMNMFSVLCIGGVGLSNQIHGLKREHDFVIGTPGRLKDLERQGRLKLFKYNKIVLDEVDRMMDMGFINDMRYLISKLATHRQSLFFSATMPDAIKGLAHSFLKNPITISVKTQDTTHTIEQDVIRLNGRSKVDVLEDLLSREGFEKVLVFGRTKWGMDKLAKILLDRGIRVAAIHGNKNQNQRQRALEEFKRGRVLALLATDVASRGLDIDDVTHVINYDEPATYEDYIHRIGRTGRASKAGTALTFID